MKKVLPVIITSILMTGCATTEDSGYQQPIVNNHYNYYNTAPADYTPVENPTPVKELHPSSYEYPVAEKGEEYVISSRYPYYIAKTAIRYEMAANDSVYLDVYVNGKYTSYYMNTGSEEFKCDGGGFSKEVGICYYGEDKYELKVVYPDNKNNEKDYYYKKQQQQKVKEKEEESIYITRTPATSYNENEIHVEGALSLKLGTKFNIHNAVSPYELDLLKYEDGYQAQVNGLFCDDWNIKDDSIYCKKGKKEWFFYVRPDSIKVIREKQAEVRMEYVRNKVKKLNRQHLAKEEQAKKEYLEDAIVDLHESNLSMEEKANEELLKKYL